MGTNKESVNELVEKLALITDSLDNIYPESKKIIVLEMNQNDFNNAKFQFNNHNLVDRQFRVEISGVEFVFILDGLLNVSSSSL
jgi:hypothetical protein